MSLRNEIALILEKNRGCTVSGQYLADSLGVTRAAVCKAVKQLRENGYNISAATNRGYILEESSDVLSEAGIRAMLEDRYSSSRITVYKSIGSTNTEAKRAAMSGAEHGTIIVADSQTNGRGRHGHSFYSPARTGLYISVVLKPEKPLSDCTLTTIAAANALADTIEELTDCKPEIKWVNDILVDGRKVCGILTEAISDFESGMVEAIIVGAGVNISTQDFPAEIADVAGSLKSSVTRNRLAAGIISRLLDYTSQADNKTLLADYRRRSAALGETVSFIRNGTEITALATDINDEGNLIVQTPNGTEVLKSGEISIRRTIS